MSDIYQNEDHLIYYGDALNILTHQINDQSADLIFADPPYNIGKQFSNFKDKWSSDETYAQWCYQWLNECIRILKPHGSLYVMASTQAMPYFDLFLRDQLTILSRIVWHYDSSGVQAKNYYGSLYEPILHCVKHPKNYTFNSDSILVEAKTGATRKLVDYRKAVPTPYNTQKVPGNVWYFPRVRYRMEEYENHPSQKPVSLLQRIILASSNENDTVLDPFAGSFTTGAVAKQLNRKSISIESQEDYLKIGLRRVLGFKEYQGQSLHPPQKSYQKQTHKNHQLTIKQGSLFDGNSST